MRCSLVMTMTGDNRGSPRPGALRDLVSLSGRAGATAFRPLSAAMGAAFSAGVGVQRRTVDRVLDSGELDQILSTALNSRAVQAALVRALESEGARRLVDVFFDSSLFDRVIERLLASDALWQLVDEVAASPSVTAAISQQGLSFAGQVGDEMRTRSRKADDWLEHAARRLKHRHPPVTPARPEAST